jgi:histone acetyltransferase (RNA polymerase elongator complex component)
MRPLIIPFFIPHAGCPHTCLFCNQHLISGVEQHLPSAQQIQETVLEWLVRSPNRAAEVAFYGGSFTLLPWKQQEQLLAAVQPLIEQQMVKSIRISTRPDALDQAVLAFLADHKVTTIEIGVQSLDDQVLLQSNRGHTAADSLAALQRVKAAGFQVGAQLLPGLPGDSQAKALASVNGVIAAGAQFVRMYPAVVLSGTALADQFNAGQYQPPDLEQGVKICARMLHLCLRAGIPVIRIGLQAEEGLSVEGAILAGCWHPALGQLVKAQLFHDLVVTLAEQFVSTEGLQLACHPDRLSELQGHARNNLISWQQFGLPIRKVQTDASLHHDQVCLSNLQQKSIGSIITTCIYKETYDA